MIELGVNIDHVATLRQSRLTTYPSPIEAALVAETAGADFITLHLREDRRHIQDLDVSILRQTLKTRMNLEMAPTESMLEKALSIKPYNVCWVPEKREELTTEGGLDVVGYLSKIADFVKCLSEVGIRTSVFIDPEKSQVDAAFKANVDAVELHTGSYAQMQRNLMSQEALDLLKATAQQAKQLGLKVAAGHGLTYHNVKPIAMIPEVSELNIGHAIISHALMVGLASAIKEMKDFIRESVLARNLFRRLSS